MKKMILIILALCVLLPLYSQEKKVITVLDFSVNNVSESDMKSITSFLSAALFDTGKYRVIDASQRNAILAELSFSASGCVDESCQLEIGKMLSAEMIVVGDIGSMGGRYILTAKLLDTETSDTVKTAKGIFQDLGDLLDNMYGFANDLAGVEDAAPAPAVAEAEPEPATIEETAETASTEEQKPAEDILETPEEKAPRGKLSTRKLIGLSCIAGGVIASGLGGYLISDLMAYYDGEYKDAEDAYALGGEGYEGYPSSWDLLTAAEQTAFYDQLWKTLEDAGNVKTDKLTVSAAVTGGGILLLGVGAVLFLLPEDPQIDNGNTAVSLLLEPGISHTSFGLSVSY